MISLLQILKTILGEAAPMLNKPAIPKHSKGVKKDPMPQSEKPKDLSDRVKNTQVRLQIMKKQLSLPHTSDARTKLQRRIVKTSDKLNALKSKKG